MFGRFTFILYLSLSSLIYSQSNSACQLQINNMFIENGNLIVSIAKKTDTPIVVSLNSNNVAFNWLDDKTLIINAEDINYVDEIITIGVSDFYHPFCIDYEYLINSNKNFEKNWFLEVYNETISNYNDIIFEIYDLQYRLDTELNSDDINYLNSTALYEDLANTRSIAATKLKTIALAYENNDFKFDITKEEVEVLKDFYKLKSKFDFLNQLYDKNYYLFNGTTLSRSKIRETAARINEDHTELYDNYENLIYICYWQDSFRLHPKLMRFYEHEKDIELFYSNELDTLSKRYSDIEVKSRNLLQEVDDVTISLQSTSSYKTFDISKVNAEYKVTADLLLKDFEKLNLDLEKLKGEYNIDTQEAYYDLKTLHESISTVDSLFSVQQKQMSSEAINTVHKDIISILSKNKKLYQEHKQNDKIKTTLIVIACIVGSILLLTLIYIYWYRHKTQKKRLEPTKQIEI